MPVKKVRTRRYKQPTSRSWSQWLTVGGYFQCCDCGSVHRMQYAYKLVKGQRKLYRRVRVHKGMTTEARKERVHKCRLA